MGCGVARRAFSCKSYALQLQENRKTPWPPSKTRNLYNNNNIHIRYS